MRAVLEHCSATGIKFTNAHFLNSLDKPPSVISHVASYRGVTGITIAIVGHVIPKSSNQSAWVYLCSVTCDSLTLIIYYQKTCTACPAMRIESFCRHKITKRQYLSIIWPEIVLKIFENCKIHSQASKYFNHQL